MNIMNLTKRSLVAACITFTLGACSVSPKSVLFAADISPALNKEQSPKNIIMLVGDGMGPAYTTAYRYFTDDPETTEVEQTVFDRLLVGMSSTHPAQGSGYITDSAAAATALATGVKSYNGAISVDTNKQPVETVLERAKKQGKKTGVVVTSQVNHATPASYLTHNESRKNYDAIANSYIDEGIKADVIFGGGWQYFIRDDRNLVNEFTSAGFHYINNPEALKTLPPQKPILGLFADVALPWALDDVHKNRLSAMTKAATKQLENDRGYFLLIEASQIDWAGHSNDIASAMAEMDDLAKTMEYLEQYVEDHPDTLVVLTADHSTGGFSIAANGKYEWDPKVLRTMKHSPQKIAQNFVSTELTIQAISKQLNFVVTKQEVAILKRVKDQTLEKLKEFNMLNNASKQQQAKPNVEEAIYIAVKKLLDIRTNSGWTTSGHTAVDVPVFAMGAGSKQFQGKLDNTDIAKKIFSLLGKH